MTVVIIHRNVDLDAILSAYIYALAHADSDYLHVNLMGCCVELVEELVPVVSITTTDYLTDLRIVKKADKVVVLDMPLKDDLKESVDEHYDHHDGSAPSTARILYEKFRDKLPEWVKYLVDLADYSDTGKVLRQPAPVKYFHLTGYINALRTAGKGDIEIIHKVLELILDYVPMLKKLAEVEKLVEDIPIYDVNGLKVAVVERPAHTVNVVLFEHKNVDLIIFKDGNNLGITRNALLDQPDLNVLKPHLKELLEEKGKPEEFEEWFFHPAGFLVARGTRKHPAETPSVLTPEDLLSLIKKL